ncbi:squamous cell carcinoma antigen recognized by T-cells 3-like [Prorops nasuta]|uniref:squamous cell carcinoma antigen recognized by T-cells 3-like n=1 Tax=Prorops nasuta TaxID=863751 RepID=UPI0034CDDF56
MEGMETDNFSDYRNKEDKQNSDNSDDDNEKDMVEKENSITEKYDDNDNTDSDFEDEEAVNEAEVKVLETALAQNPYDYSSHIGLIVKLQKMGELDRLRTARENMSLKYPLSPELWLSWMKDEINLATSLEQKANVVQLCERAVKDYLSVEVWLEYLQFSIGNMGADKDASKKVRQLFEQALTAVGLHTIKGAIIWEAFREFESVLYALIDQENQAEKKEQINRIGNLFRRQLACPLLDMDKTYEEYKAWRKEDGADATIDDNIVKECYERGLAKLTSLLPFEEVVVSSQNESETLDAYKAYLLHEKQNSDPGRITVLFERAIAELSLEVSLWLDYVNYLENNIKIENILQEVYRRASRNIPWCALIWQKWIRAYEKWNKPVIEVQSLFENSLLAGFSNAEDYRNLWLTYLEYLRRGINVDSKEEENKQIDIIRRAYNNACEHLAKLFGLEGDPSCVILQYWARTEAIHANNMEKARSLWSDILSQGHSATAASWLEYISLERCYGDTKHLRKLYQKALTSVKDWPESIANAWIDFERDEGTLEQMELCELKTKEKLEKVAEERQKSQQMSQYESSTAQHRKASKRKYDDGPKWKNLGSSPVKIIKTEGPSLKQTEAASDKNTKLISGKEESSKSKVAPPPGFKPPETDKMDIDQSNFVDDKITVFVSNLDYTATEEEVRKALEPAGPITLFKMIKDYKGRSKGFCYVQLNSTSAVDEALKLDRSPIRGRPMFVSRCDPDRTTRSTGFKYSSILEKNKLFVKGLPVTTTKEELEQIFKIHGTLKEVRIVTYRNGHSKGLAYVEYDDVNSAAKALIATDGMTVGDKVISVAISQPPARKKTEEDLHQIKSLGSTSVSRSTFGLPKTLLSMVPRNVKLVTNNGNDPSTSNTEISKPKSNQDFRNMLLNKK